MISIRNLVNVSDAAQRGRDEHHQADRGGGVNLADDKLNFDLAFIQT